MGLESASKAKKPWALHSGNKKAYLLATSVQEPSARYVITGASGFVGRQLVPLLKAQNIELLLVGRDPALLRQLFPGTPSSGYGEWLDQGRGYDALIHLAVLNNNHNGTQHEFDVVNVWLLQQTLEQAREAGIRRFINVSSVHALGTGNDPYSVSKRRAASALKEIAGIETQTFYLPLVHGKDWSGKLAFLNRLPRGLARHLFIPLAALVPTLHVRKLAAALSRPSPHDHSQEDPILSNGQSANWAYRCCSRVIDLGFAVSMLLLFWWLLLGIALSIRLTSPGPAIFAQIRVGRHEKPFRCYKFRTMKMGTAQAATHEIPASAITPLGQFLRRTKLDELPQIWNILRNEVSLVGPRPCLPSQTWLIEERRKRGVMNLKPGITGLSQVNGFAMDEPERLAIWDSRYGALQSLTLDLKIILATVMGRGHGDQVAVAIPPS